MKKSNICLLIAGALLLVTVALHSLGFRAIMDTADAGDAIEFVYTEREVNEHVPVAPDARIEIINVSGSVKVVGWDREEVEITGTLCKGVKELSCGNSPKGLRIEVILPKAKIHTDKRAMLDIRVPRQSTLVIKTVSASIDVNEHTGDRIRCKAVSGDVSCVSTAAEVKLKTVSGSIDLAGKSKKTELHSVSGTIRARGSHPAVTGETVSGDVIITSDAAAEYELNSTSGDITVRSGSMKSGTLRCETVSGDVDLAFPAMVSARFDIATKSGDITNGLNDARPQKRKFTIDKKLAFTAGDGAGTVTVRTVSGDVTLNKTAKDIFLP